MAKCIKYPGGVIARYDDKTAAAIVDAGAAHYTTKSAWKAFDNGTRRSIAHEEAMKRKVLLRDVAQIKDWSKAERRKAARAKKRAERFSGFATRSKAA
jgi:hypothetical protein